MAAAHGMIEPFEPGQVRSVDGKRIVSYGTSSYGYDVRSSPTRSARLRTATRGGKYQDQKGVTLAKF